MRRLFFLLLAVMAFSWLMSCGQSDKYADSFILGDWAWETPVYDSGGEDCSASYWAAHDAFTYRFLKNGVYIKSGGPEPMEPAKYCFEIVGDSLLHLYISSDMFYDESYKIISLSHDTIWLEANSKDQDHGRPLRMQDTEQISYLVRFK